MYFHVYVFVFVYDLCIICQGISKLASKLFKASKENSGTISNAWHFVANDFEQTAEVDNNIFA